MGCRLAEAWCCCMCVVGAGGCGRGVGGACAGLWGVREHDQVPLTVADPSVT